MDLIWLNSFQTRKNTYIHPNRLCKHNKCKPHINQRIWLKRVIMGRNQWWCLHVTPLHIPKISSTVEPPPPCLSLDTPLSFLMIISFNEGLWTISVFIKIICFLFQNKIKWLPIDKPNESKYFFHYHDHNVQLNACVFLL